MDGFRCHVERAVGSVCADVANGVWWAKMNGECALEFPWLSSFRTLDFKTVI